jgi:hypothetical protein
MVGKIDGDEGNDKDVKRSKEKGKKKVKATPKPWKKQRRHQRTCKTRQR